MSSSTAKAGSPTKKAAVKKGMLARRRLSLMPGSLKPGEHRRLDGAGKERKASVSETEKKKKKPEASTGGKIKGCSSLSRVGFVPFNNSKVNQDRYTEHIKFAGEDSKSLFGVFDGHGVFGHEVSQFLIDHLPGMIAKGKDLAKSPKAQITRTFIAANMKLKKSDIDTTCSGTTAVVCYLVDKKILTFNSGDSRACIGCLKDGKLVAKALSIDQKPELESERKRILQHNGRVQACTDLDGNPIGPLRVWLKHQNIPGLAMTRSFGDHLASTVGVTCKPAIMEHVITEADQFIILGSDGIWEFITNQEAVDMVGKEPTMEAAALKLVEEATRRWRQEEEVIDDITATVVYFKNSSYPKQPKK